MSSITALLYCLRPRTEGPQALIVEHRSKLSTCYCNSKLVGHRFYDLLPVAQQCRRILCNIFLYVRVSDLNRTTPNLLLVRQKGVHAGRASNNSPHELLVKRQMQCVAPKCCNQKFCIATIKRRSASNDRVYVRICQVWPVLAKLLNYYSSHRMSENFNFASMVCVESMLYELLELFLDVLPSWVLTPVVGKRHEVLIVCVSRFSKIAE